MAHTSQALTAQLSRVTVTLTAADAPTATVALTVSEGAWSGTLHNIPAGVNRTFTGEAFDAQGQLLFRGIASGVTITAGETALVALTLQSLNPVPSIDNTAPCIDSVVASSSTVRPGGTIALQVTAHDADAGDSLSYAWTAAAGSLSASSTTTTVWTAPATEGPVMVIVTVTDSHGAFATANITLTVLPANGANQGAASFTVSFNTSPSVQSITTSLSPISVGQSATLTAVGTDLDGDTLSYAWSASCQGTWTNANSPTASFTPSAVPSGDSCGNCALTVTVTDGHGGQNTGTLRVCVNSGSDNGVSFPPHIILAHQSAQSVTGGSLVTLRVLAEDGDGGALTFSWSTSSGTLGTPATGFTSSEVVWTAPACAPADAAPFITATVTNALGFSASHRFTVTVQSAADCSGGENGPPPSNSTWDITGAMGTARYSHKALLLTSGKVLVAGGVDGGRWLDTAELYNPATGTWAPAGRMQQIRENNYTLTLLPSGKVLAIGGTQGSQQLRSAELYDPTTNTWSAVAPLTFTRTRHTATVLPSGKVLVIGGNSDSTAGRVPELYDPATNTWLPLTASAGHHFDHQALVLSTGKVLVLGGNYPTEVYDPGTNAWTSSPGGLSQTGWQAAWVLAPDKLLLLAGRSFSFYDPIHGVETDGGELSYTRTSHTVTRLASGKLLVTGGIQSASPIAELYDPTTGATSVTLSMPAARAYHTATLLPSGKVLVVGGNTNPVLNSALLFTP
ncbi:kelch repeat-containing protein [Hyalangium versicolor]|uniref:kelch repeat-containing protein n=1 Tax=Hyalangium versicolor TaxID=2861190 RepID=UPI001CCACBD1|nr:kelch repeat-containing protein [Hyalangium versicolor]